MRKATIPIPDLNEKDKVRFLAKLPQREPDQCWEWMSSRSPRGYGNFFLKGKSIRASRISYALHIGPITGEMYVCHHCDNPPCCNPAHLFLGDDSSNMQDMANKKRHPYPKGENHYSKARPDLVPKGNGIWNSVLDEEIVGVIRGMYKQGIMPKEISEKLSLKRSTVTSVVLRVTWKHVH